MPTPGNNSTSVSQIYKQWYKDGGLVITTYQKHPYWAAVQKRPDSSETEGSTFQFAMMYNDVQSRNTVFAGAQSQARGLSAYNTSALTGTVAGPYNVGAIGVVQFSVPRCFNYGLVNISTELQLATRTKRGAFDNAVTRISDSVLNVLGGDQEISLFGGNIDSSGISTAATGFISTIGSATDVTSSTGVLTLGSVFDVNRFSQNQELDLYYNNGGVITKRTNIAGHGLFVVGINRNAGTLTIGTSPGNTVAINSVFSTAAVGDFICVSNDFNQGAATGASGTGKINSFESWVPFGGPVADTNSNLFCGQNRNNYDVTRVAGNWLDATGAIGPFAGTVLNIEDAIITMAQQVNQNSDGEDIDTIALAYNQDTRLKKSNMARTVLPGGKIATSVPSLNFKGIQVNTDSGDFMVMPSKMCGPNRLYGLQMDSWAYIHLGEPVELNTLDGRDVLRAPDMDATEMRAFAFGNLVCEKPGANITCHIGV